MDETTTFKGKKFLLILMKKFTNALMLATLCISLDLA